MNINLSDYKIERIAPSQWQNYKLIRLEALKTNPELFGSSYAKEVLYSQDDWIALLENDARAIFALYHLDLLIGLSGVVLNRDNQSEAILISSFIKEAYRGRGLSQLFFQARIEWARQKECAQVIVSHRAGNEASKAANQRCGFVYTYSKESRWPDGLLAEELMYCLSL